MSLKKEDPLLCKFERAMWCVLIFGTLLTLGLVIAAAGSPGSLSEPKSDPGELTDAAALVITLDAAGAF